MNHVRVLPGTGSTKAYTSRGATLFRGEIEFWAKLDFPRAKLFRAALLRAEIERGCPLKGILFQFYKYRLEQNILSSILVSVRLQDLNEMRHNLLLFLIEMLPFLLYTYYKKTIGNCHIPPSSHEGTSCAHLSSSFFLLFPPLWYFTDSFPSHHFLLSSSKVPFHGIYPLQSYNNY